MQPKPDVVSHPFAVPVVRLIQPEFLKLNLSVLVDDEEELPEAEAGGEDDEVS